ncbi:MAG: lysyl oxidase family protein [Chitinophagales bacterium]
MMKKISSYLALISVISLFPILQLSAQCVGNQVEVEVIIEPDAYAATETDWTVTDESGTILAFGSDAGQVICVDPSLCLTFTITDSYGDGLNGFPPNSPPGSYSVFYNGALIDEGVNFGYETSALMGGCSSGISCALPDMATIETIYNATLDDHWYEFTPTETGQYSLTSCFPNNTCDTRIWVYDICDGIQWDDTQEGSIFYNDDATCGAQAEGITNLAANTTYYIRIGDGNDDCASTPIAWQVTYIGEISGCTDNTACNYEPLATIDDESCIFQGNPLCPDGPDLAIIQSEIVNSMYVQEKDNSDACFVNEGCMNGYGIRQILRFTTRIENIGNQDYFIGQTPTEPNDQWEWDDCHNHWHYEGYAEYALYDLAGNRIPIGFKNGFCVMDLYCPPGLTAKFNCSNQGITAGCADYYDAGLNCQWIDLTDVAEGLYTFVVRVNWDQSPDALGRYELTYDNNWAQVCIELSRDSTGALSVNVSDTCDPYIDCAGELYGSAELDCEGVCDGTTIAGDLSADGAYGTDDLAMYFQAILDDSMTPTYCNDVASDGMITVLDPVLVASCMLQEAGMTQDSHDHCDLPSGAVINPETATFDIGNLDMTNQYFDIYVTNPTVHLLAYNLEISGVEISMLEDLIPDSNYNVDLGYNMAGEILALSPSESIVPRYITATPILRVHFSSLLDTEICLTNLITLVNDSHEEFFGMINNGCLQTNNGTKAFVKVNLEGSMTSAILLPSSQPYNTTPWSYNGNETNTSIPPAVVDWVLVEARDAVNNAVVVSQAAGLLLNDGRIVDADLTDGVTLDITVGTAYYIVVRHRNHLDVMSANTVVLPNTTAYDFTTSMMQAMGNNQMVAMANGNYAMAAGDFSGNGLITTIDYDMYQAQASLINGYNNNDCTLDSYVTVADFNAFLRNFNKVGITEIRY